MTSTPEQKPLLTEATECRFIHRPDRDRQLEFRIPRQALAAKAEFAFAKEARWEARGKSGLAEAALDDVFTDDITFPARDGYLLGATLFLPRGAKRHAVLINSATAVPLRPSPRNGFTTYI